MHKWVSKNLWNCPRKAPLKEKSQRARDICPNALGKGREKMGSDRLHLVRDEKKGLKEESNHERFWGNKK